MVRVATKRKLIKKNTPTNSLYMYLTILNCCRGLFQMYPFIVTPQKCLKDVSGFKIHPKDVGKEIDKGSRAI